MSQKKATEVKEIEKLRKERVGERLKKARESLNISQIRLAEQVGVSQGTISKWERGLCEIPYSVMEYLAKAYNVNLHWLLTGEGEMFIKREHKIPTEKASIVPELASFLALLPEEQQKQLASIFKEFLKTSSAMPSGHISPHSEEKRAESDRIGEVKRSVERGD